VRNWSKEQYRIYKTFVDATGRNLHNAGVFAGVISRKLPRWPEPVDPGAVCERLRNQLMPMRWYVAHYQDPLGEAERAPLSPRAFASQIDAALAAYSEDDLKHWFRHGRGPLKSADSIVHQMAIDVPKQIPDLVKALLGRPRLAGAAARMSGLAGALVLPPRRLASAHLPLGGYVDVAVRGQPHDILPSQFMLDEPEFDRRYAEHELLYFRREEPQAAGRQELIAILD
jgi:hypothetical protein